MVPEDGNKGIVFRGKPCGKKKEDPGCTSMLEYYQDHQHAGLTPSEKPGFDPIRRKYDVAAIAEGVYRELEQGGDAFACLGEEKNAEIQSIWNNILGGEDKKQALCELIHQWFSQYEASTGVPNLKQRDFGHTMGNLHMIYNQDLGEILDAVRLMDMVSRHVINQYIGIDGLDNLFSEQYIDFEWEMHLGMDHGKHSTCLAHFSHLLGL